MNNEIEDLKYAAESGDTRAQFELGVCYENGDGVPKDLNQAIKWYRLAAEQGEAAAQCNLGICYANGDGVPKDLNQAIKWFELAAEQGHAKSQYNLGVFYAKGSGVPVDLNQAIKWFELAADQGHANAQYNLGVCYENGDGIPKDLNEAEKWYKLSADQGHADAKAAYNKSRSEREKEEKKSGGCYIATMVYGDYDAPEVLILRRFRDKVLAKSILGRLFIQFYYLTSPTIVKILRHSSTINKGIKRVLDLLVIKTKKHI